VKYKRQIATAVYIGPSPSGSILRFHNIKTLSFFTHPSLLIQDENQRWPPLRPCGSPLYDNRCTYPLRRCQLPYHRVRNPDVRIACETYTDFVYPHLASSALTLPSTSTRPDSRVKPSTNVLSPSAGTLATRTTSLLTAPPAAPLLLSMPVVPRRLEMWVLPTSRVRPSSMLLLPPLEGRAAWLSRV
jgi:hypothetical protein